MSYLKVYKYKKQISLDNGVTWQDVTPAEYAPSGDPIGYYDTYEECMAQYRTIQSGYTCVGYDKHNQDVYEVSYDNGVITESLTLQTPTRELHDLRRKEKRSYVPWAMESSKSAFCASAVGGARVQPCRGGVAKHPGCCSLLVGKRLGAFLSGRFPETVKERTTSSCLPGCPTAPVAGERQCLGKGWREATA